MASKKKFMNACELTSEVKMYFKSDEEKREEG